MEIKQNSILFIAYDCSNKAVWNALKMHIELVYLAGYNISFMVNEKYQEIVKEDYPNSKIYTYKNLFDLMIKLNRVSETKIYSPVTFCTLASFLAKVLKSKEIYYWVQGVIPEESFLRHKSKIRYIILSLIEYLSLTISTKQIFVSNEMQRYLEKKYKKQYNNSIVVPCISEFNYDNSIKEKDSFIYLGGMSAWQRIDKMLKFFNDIVKVKHNAKLYIATLERQKAQEYIELYLDKENFSRVEVLSLENRDEVQHFLSTKEYGFLIREESVVNYVSSPIKLAEYLSCGVNLIISASVKSYASYIEKNGSGISLKENDNIIDKIKNYTPSIEKALETYRYFFSKDKHILNYKELLK